MNGTLNKVILIGHLGEDVKLHYFDGGNCIGRFSLATNESYTNKSTGDRVTNTEWHNVVLRDKAAEICEKYLSKGDKVYVEGKMKTRKWQTKEGVDRGASRIIDKKITFLNTKKQTDKIGNQASPQSQKAEETPPDDDLPF